MMKRVFTILLLLAIGLAAYSQSPVVPGQQVPITKYSYSSIPEAYLYLPWDYNITTKRYPLIIFYKGAGESGSGGDDLPKMLNNGIPQLINQGEPPYSVNRTTGDTTWFIVLSPQTPSNIPSSAISSWQTQLLKFYNLRIDTNRIYGTGLSLGGEDMYGLMKNNGTTTYQGAAGVSMSPAHRVNPTQGDLYSDAHIWFFQGDNDGTVGQTGTQSYDFLQPLFPDNDYRLTTYPGGHCCWNTFYDPTWKSNDTSIYDYMMQYSLNENTVPGNNSPAANAGEDQTLPSGTTFTTLSGSGTDSDGEIVSYNWTTSSGAVITSPNSAETGITNLEDGETYYFTLTVTDDKGATSSDDVAVTVKEFQGPIKKVNIDFSGQSGWKVYKWNNFVNNSTTTGIIPNLLDTANAPTGISLQVTTTFTGVTASGQTTGNNTGVVPDSVLQRGFYVNAGKVGVLNFSGLDNTKTYTFKFIGSSSSLTQSHVTVFTVGDKSDSVEARANTTDMAKIVIKPTTGNISVSVKEGTGATNAYLNGIIITYIDSTEVEPVIDTPIYKIPLSPYTKFWSGDTVFYQMNDINASGKVDSLIDEQSADPLHGVNTPVPITSFWTGNSTELSYPAEAVIDLGGYYKITNEYFYDNSGTATMQMIYGEPNNWSTDTLRFNPSGTGWSDARDTIYTRYLKVGYDTKLGGYQKTTEMILYGYLAAGDSMSRVGTVQPNNYVTKSTMGQFVGVNSYGDVPIRVRDVAGLLREYVAQDYLDTINANVPPDSLKFVISKFSKPDSGAQTPYYFPEATDLRLGEKTFGSIYNELNYYKNNGQVGLFSILNVPTYFKTIGTKPVTPGTSTDSASSYIRTARLAFNLAAVFGSRKVPVDSIQVSNYDSTGLNVMQYLETGNEMNATWGNTKMYYYSPQEFMAYSSALYDGDAGTMGHQAGIKTADPNMTVVAAGDAGIHLERLKPYKYFSYYYRPDHKFPLDVFNFHAYPAGKSPGGAISPENDTDLNNRISGFADSCREICPTCEVWITEWGYDRNRATNLGVPPIQDLDSAQIQAMWTARYWFKLSFMGVDRAVIFQIRNDPLQKDYDSSGVNQFNTTGLTSGHYYPAAQAPDGLNSTNYYAYPVYYFQRTLWKKLYNYRPDSIVYDNHDSIWVYRYRNVNSPDSVAYAVWSGTQTNRSTDAYSLKTGHANTQVSFTKLEDKQMLGVTSTPTSDAGGNLPLVISETPVMIFTTEGVDGGQLVENDGPVNDPPIANAGGDKTIRLPINSVSLAGSGTNGTGNITTQVWTKVSGGAATISNPNNYSTDITGLAQGTYVFRLTVTDDNNLSSTDDVNVTVLPAYVGPIVSAGINQTLPASTTTANLTGTVTKGDGAITSYKWEQVSGSTVNIISPTSISTSITGLTNGNTYLFKLTATDSNSLSSSSNVAVTVESDIPTVTKKVVLYLLENGKIILIN